MLHNLLESYEKSLLKESEECDNILVSEEETVEDDMLLEDGERVHFKKHGFVRIPEKDFSDDGTRFYMYIYNGMPVSYAKWNDEYFISARPDYNQGLNWDEYRELPGYDKFDDLNGVFKVTDDDLEELKKNIDIFQQAYKDKVNNIEQVSDDDITAVYDDIKEFKKNELKEITDIIRNVNVFDLDSYDLKTVKDYYKALKDAVSRWEISADKLSKLTQVQRRYIKRPSYIDQEKRASFYYDKIKEILSKASKWEESLKEECNSYSYKDCVIINDSKANCWRIKDSKGNWIGNCFSTDDEAEEFIDSKDESLEEDTVKTKSGKWVNKGKEGTHGEFRTKKAADAQRKAMFANGYEAKESLNEASWWTDEDRFDVNEWEKEDIEKWKTIDWSQAENGEYEDVDDEIISDAYLYSDEPVKVKEVVMHKFFRQNPTYPPYYRPVEDPFQGVAGPMADGRMHGKYDIHDRYETWDLYNWLSESKKIRNGLSDAGYRK